jgi:hypothetical protein
MQVQTSTDFLERFLMTAGSTGMKPGNAVSIEIMPVKKYLLVFS